MKSSKFFAHLGNINTGIVLYLIFDICDPNKGNSASVIIGFKRWIEGTCIYL